MNTPRTSTRTGLALVAMLAAFLAAMIFGGCVTTQPYSAHARPDGTRVGESRQVVFLRPYDMAEAIHVAQDNAGITSIDTARHRMRVRAWGTCYITTVVGK